MTDDVVEVAEEETVEVKKESKKGKWTLEKATYFLNHNGHKVGEKQVHLGANAGIHTFGCADYLKNYHKFEIIYPER